MTTFAADGSVIAAPPINGHAPADHTGVTINDPSGVDPLPTGDFAPAEPQVEPSTPVLDPQPVTIDPEPEVPAAPELPPEPPLETPADDEAQSEPAVPTLDAGWPHDWLQFHGDKLGVRIPASDAYAPVQIAEMGHTQPGLAQRLSVRFLEMHIAPQSYERVMERIMDPDEPDFTGKALGELVNVLSALNSAGDAAE